MCDPLCPGSLSTFIKQMCDLGYPLVLNRIHRTLGHRPPIPILFYCKMLLLTCFTELQHVDPLHSVQMTKKSCSLTLCLTEVWLLLIEWCVEIMEHQTNKTRVRVWRILKALEKESSFTMSADRGRGAVETEWVVVVVWTMMLVHDDWSQTCLSQHTKWPIVLVSSLMLSYDVLACYLETLTLGVKLTPTASTRCLLAPSCGATMPT